MDTENSSLSVGMCVLVILIAIFVATLCLTGVFLASGGYRGWFGSDPLRDLSFRTVAVPLQNS